MTVTLTGPGPVTATADMVTAARLDIPTRRTAYDVRDDEYPLITAATAGALSGALTYLCPTLAAALALADVYKLGTCTLTTGTGEPLNGLVHVAIGTIRVANDRTRWTVTAEIKEQP